MNCRMIHVESGIQDSYAWADLPCQTEYLENLMGFPQVLKKPRVGPALLNSAHDLGWLTYELYSLSDPLNSSASKQASFSFISVDRFETLEVPGTPRLTDFDLVSRRCSGGAAH